MKWTENFNTHRVKRDQMIAQLHYLDLKEKAPTSWLSEGEAQTPELSIQPQVLSVQLENRMVQSRISKEQVLDMQKFGIDPIGEAKKAISREWDFNIESELFNHTFALARTMGYKQEFTGIKGWFYRLFDYQPLIWADSDEFLDSILKGSNEIIRRTRMGAGGWIMVSPEVATRFGKLNDFVYGSDGLVSELNSQVTQFGKWKHLTIYTSLLIDKDQILMGRKTTSNHDTVVSLVISGDGWLQSETVSEISFEPVYNLGLRRGFKVFDVPGSENSYLKWQIATKEPRFWKHLAQILAKSNPFRPVVDLLRRKRV